jgi:rubrerythrin
MPDKGSKADAGISVMDFAIRAEEEGAAFYAASAKLADNPEVQAYLSALAKEEAKHAQTFRTLKDKIVKKGIADSFVDPEVGDYLDAVIRGGLFEAARGGTNGGTELPKTFDDVYRIAIRAERSSILLYEAMAEAAVDRGLKKAIQTMVREEKSHLVKVVALRADRDNLFAIERFGCMC